MRPNVAESAVIAAGALMGTLCGVTQVDLPWIRGGASRRPSAQAPFPAITATLFRSGSLDNGVSAVVPFALCADDDAYEVDQGEALGAWAASVAGGFEGAAKCEGCALYDETAKRIASCADLEDASSTVGTLGGDLSVTSGLGAQLWVVEPGKWFVFPTGALGRAVAVARVPPPRGKAKPITVETLSLSPRVFHLHNFITEAESDALVAYALANTDPILGLQRSTTGAEHQVSFNKVRTSENAFDSVSPTARAVKRRAIQLLGMEPYEDEMTDGLQVLRYNLSKAYIPHLDFLEDNDSGHNYDASQGGSNRFATILFYLSDVQEGGETVFTEGVPVDDGMVDEVDGIVPRVSGKPGSGRERPEEVLAAMADGSYYRRTGRRHNNGSLVEVGRPGVDGARGLFPKGSWEETMVGQCRSSLAVRPKKAHAVLFYSQRPDGTLDPSSKHGGCPVLGGTKWAANLWIWNRVRLGYPRAPRKAGASAFDASRGVGRDRMAKEGNQAAAKGLQAPKQPLAVFHNRDVPGAKLFYAKTSFMGDLPVGQALRFNSYEGHEWSVQDASGRVVAEFVVGPGEGEQAFTVASSSAAPPAPSKGPTKRPAGARPPM